MKKKNPRNCLLHFVSGQLFLEAWHLDLGAKGHMTIKEEHNLFFPINFQVPL